MSEALDSLHHFLTATEAALLRLFPDRKVVFQFIEGREDCRMASEPSLSLPFWSGTLHIWTPDPPDESVQTWFQQILALWESAYKRQFELYVLQEIVKDLSRADGLRALAGLFTQRVKVLLGFQQVLYLHSTDGKHYSCLGHWKLDGKIGVDLTSSIPIKEQLLHFGLDCDLIHELRLSSGNCPALVVGTKKWRGVVSQQDIETLEFLTTLVAPLIQKYESYELALERQQSPPEPVFAGIVGQSASMRKVFDQIERLIQSGKSTNILIRGETGTGKELVARAIHFQGPRRDKPFVVVNCGAIPHNLIESELFGHERGAFTDAKTMKRGKFELASGGTIFLDEIGDLPLEAQVKVLRAIQNRQIERLGASLPIDIDVQVVAATHVDLQKHVEEKHFREDLFYRLNVFPIDVPALRQRREDIDLLLRHFLRRQRRTETLEEHFSPAALEVLRMHDWPGNIRELENLMERLEILAVYPVEAEDLPLEMRMADRPRIPHAAVEAPSSDLFTGDENEFLSLLRSHAFQFDPCAARLSISVFRVRDRFKGLVFKTLCGTQFDLARCARQLTQGTEEARIRSKVAQYVNNLLELRRETASDSYATLLKKLPFEYREFANRVADAMKTSE